MLKREPYRSGACGQDDHNSRIHWRTCGRQRRTQSGWYGSGMEPLAGRGESRSQVPDPYSLSRTENNQPAEEE